MRHFLRENQQFIMQAELKRLGMNQADMEIKLNGVIDEQKLLEQPDIEI